MCLFCVSKVGVIHSLLASIMYFFYLDLLTDYKSSNFDIYSYVGMKYMNLCVVRINYTLK